VRAVAFSRLDRNLDAELRRVVDDAEDLMVTRSGHEPVVIMPLSRYESLRRTSLPDLRARPARTPPGPDVGAG